MKQHHLHQRVPESGSAEIILESSGCDVPGRQPAKERRFEGYTLEEIRYLRLVNRLKTDIARERLALVLSPQVRREADTVAGAVSSFQSVMKWADIAIAAYGVGRRVASFFRRFRSEK